MEVPASASSTAEIPVQDVDWTRLPDACRIIIAQHMDDLTRAAWRTVNTQCSQDTYTSTRTLTCCGEDRQRKRLAPQPIKAEQTSDSAATLLSKLLAKLPHLHHLKCTHMLSITSVPSTLPSTLVSLDLTHCWRVSDLAPVQACTSLQRLLLAAEGESIYPLITSLQSITPTMAASLTHLSLTADSCFDVNNTLTNTLVAAIQPLKHLQRLRLILGGRGWSTLWAPLSPVLALKGQLHTLDLTNSAMCGAGASAVATAIGQLQRLQSLLLGGNYMCATGTSGIEALSRAVTHLQGLTCLDLSFNSLTSHSTTALAALLRGLRRSPLCSLLLQNNPITASRMAELCPALAHHAALTELDFGWCSIGDAGALHLTEALEHCTGLRSLRLRDNSISAFGYATLAPRLHSLASSLVSLSLTDRGQPLDAPTLTMLLRGMTCLAKLDFAAAEPSPASIVLISDALRALTSMQDLNVYFRNCRACLSISGPLVEAFQAMTLLRSLTLDMNLCTEGVQALVDIVPGLGSLCWLDVNMLTVSPGGDRLLRATIASLEDRTHLYGTR